MSNLDSNTGLPRDAIALRILASFHPDIVSQAYAAADAAIEAMCKERHLWPGTLPPETSIRQLDLSVRTINGLKSMDLCSLGDIVDKTADELCKIRNFGYSSLEELREALRLLGLSLRGD